MTTFTNRRNSCANSLLTDADYCFHNSLADQTIRRHSSPSIFREDRPLVTYKVEKLFPQSPTNQYVSQYVDRFNNYFGYGSTQYHFRIFLCKENITLRRQFGRNFEPTFLRLGRDQSHLLFLYLILPPNLPRSLLFCKFLGLLRVCNIKIIQKQAKEYTFQQVSLESLIFHSLPKSPNITISNFFPSINFQLGLVLKAEDYMRILVD